VGPLYSSLSAATPNLQAILTDENVVSCTRTSFDLQPRQEMISSELPFHRTFTWFSYFVEKTVLFSRDQPWLDFSVTDVYSLVVAPQSLNRDCCCHRLIGRRDCPERLLMAASEKKQHGTHCKKCNQILEHLVPTVTKRYDKAEPFPTLLVDYNSKAHFELITQVMSIHHFFLPSSALFPLHSKHHRPPRYARRGLSLLDNRKSELSACGSSFYV